MGWIRKRVGEASTMAGLGVIGAAIEAYMAGGSKATIPVIVAGLLAILMPEKGNQ